MCKVSCILFCILWCVSVNNASSDPLILTPYLKIDDVEKARELSRVKPDLGDVLSYSGYFAVDENKILCDKNLFFWFFPAVKDWENAPVILWLQGGPGASSMFGLFELIGPFNSFPEGLQARNTSWINFANLLFIDNPVGVGFSFANNRKCYPKSISTVSEDLHSALKQFFKLFPELRMNKFFLTGESFAGHYLPALGALIDKKNSKKGERINMKGIIMGNPLVKLDCHDYASFLYQVGIADATLRDELYASQLRLKKHVKMKSYLAAFKDWNYIVNDLIEAKTDIPSNYNILTESPDPSNYDMYLNTSSIKTQLHVGSQGFVDINTEVYFSLRKTIAQPFASEIQKLLKTKKYIVGIYSGNLDIVCMYTSSECVLRDLKWSGQNDYLKASRKIWYLNDQVVGWFKTADNLLLDIVVKDAQHAAIYSQPEVTYRMMESIATAKPGQNPLWALQTSESTA